MKQSYISKLSVPPRTDLPLFFFQGLAWTQTVFVYYFITRMWKREDADEYRLFLFSPTLHLRASDISLLPCTISDCPAVPCRCLMLAENGIAFSFISLGWRRDVQTWVLLTMPALGIICFNISTSILSLLFFCGGVWEVVLFLEAAGFCLADGPFLLFSKYHVVIFCVLPMTCNLTNNAVRLVSNVSRPHSPAPIPWTLNV